MKANPEHQQLAALSVDRRRCRKCSHPAARFCMTSGIDRCTSHDSAPAERYRQSVFFTAPASPFFLASATNTRIISSIESGLLKVRAGAIGVRRFLCQECAMPAVMQNEGHMNAAELWSRRALGLTGLAYTFAWRLPQHGVKVTTTKAANFACWLIRGVEDRSPPMPRS